MTTVTKNKSRMPMGIAAALVLALGLWILLGRRPQPTIPEELQELEQTVVTEEPQPMQEAQPSQEANPVVAVPTSDLTKFLAAASASELPKRFRIDNPKSREGVDQIVAAMNEYSTVMGRIEGTGAEAFKSELVARGIDPSRLEVGANPQPSAATDDGIEFVVTAL